MSFPERFVWGAAAAAYQIEGGAEADGKGLSVWDVFSRYPGNVFEGHTGDVACDHYHRYAEDVALMKEIGLQAYRLSISWPRVLPEGSGAPNEAGLAFYDRLVDTLLEAGITPYVTLFHWDYPYELFCQGGWLNRDAARWFADYTTLVVNRLGDRVKHWMTHNEPSVFVQMGHGSGEHAPGLQHDLPQLYRMAHHVLLAHGQSVQAIRSEGGADVQVGLVLTGNIALPANNSEAEVAVAHARTFNMDAGDGLWQYSFWGDPAMKGEYPGGGNEHYQRFVARVDPADMAIIHQPLDFLGMNIYQGWPTQAGDDGQPQPAKRPAGYPITLMHWPVTPDVLYWGPRFMHERYGLPIYITENGLSNMDWVGLDGQVHDPQRIDYTRRYLRALRRAGEDGVTLGGYFHWSVMDNFEWAWGYSQRFGLIHVDFETGQRTPKDSARWYREVIDSNGARLDQD